MPELRLQSDMLNNMSLAQRRAMMQRGMIWQNQQIGAFEGEEYYGGRTNSYQRYYAAQQARQAEFQRQRFLNAQKFQNNYMLQQQKAQDIQFAEEQKVTRTKDEMERKLKFLNKELDAYLKNQEVDKKDFETQNAIAKIRDDIYEVETGLERNTPQKHQVDSGFTKTVIDPKTGKPKEEPIMSEYWMGPDDQPVWTVEGSKVAANQLERDKFEQAKIDAARKANHEKEVLAVAQQNAKTARLKEENAQAVNERKASGADVDPEAEAMEKFGQDAHDELMRKRKNKVKDFLKMDGKLKDGQTTEEKDEIVQQFIDDDRFEGPTKQEQRDEAMKMWERTQPIPQDRLQEEAMYESPMDPGMEPEFSDEQFAGTEPAGLYDPTGQPLPMDGGMYNGYS